MNWEKAVKLTEEKMLDGLILSDGYNMRYLSGFTGATGYLYISPKRRVLLTDSRYTVQAREESQGFEVLEVNGKYMDCLLYTSLVLQYDNKLLLFFVLDLLVKKNIKCKDFT